MTFKKNYIVVGTPKVSSDFIASDFLDGSYLKVVRNWEDAFTIHTKIRTPSSWQAGYSCLFEFNTSVGNLSVNLERNFIIYSYSQKKDVSVLTPQLNTDYYIRWTIDFTHNEKRFSYSLDNNAWSDEIIVQDSQMNIGENVFLIIGSSKRFNNIWSGSLDLNNTFITVGEDIVWKAVEQYFDSGSILVSKGYYNIDGTNIIKFTEDITKTLTEAKATLNCGNKVILTLDNANQSDFIVNGVMSNDPTGYKRIKKLETPLIITDPTKQYILGTEPTGIEYQVTPQKPGGNYELKYLTLNGSVSYDETTGKLSGFSESNYATSSSGITFGNSFDLIFSVTVGSSSTQQTLFYGKDDRGLLFTSGKIAAWFGSNVLGVTSVINGNTYWIRLVWDGARYIAYSLLDDGTYTLATLPEISSWTQEFTSSSSTNIFAPGYWIGYHSQATSQYARSIFNMGKAQITTGGVTYRYADGDADAGSVSFTKGWDYEPSLNRSYQIKSNQTIPLSELIANTSNLETVGYKNSVGLAYESNSDESTPIIFKTSQREPLIIVPNIYIDNTKTNLLGTTATSESWKEIESAFEVYPGFVGGDNYTILGSDAKVIDGIATGFTNTSGLTIPNNPFVNADINSIKILFEVTTGSETTPYQEVLAQNNCILIRRGNGNNWSLAVYTGSSWLDYAFGNFELNTKYYIRILYFKSATTFEGFAYNGGYTYMEVSKDNATWTRQSANQKPLFDSGKPMYIGYNGSAEAWSGSIDLNNTKFYLNDTLVWSLNPSTGSVKINKGYKYIDEINGTFLIEADTTKTLEEVIVGDKTEQMGLYLVNKTDLTTDFVLSATEPTTDITYAEKLQDVYLDRTLSYIYGNTADTRVKLTINATPNTATVNIVDSAPSTPVQVSGIGTATILVDPSNNAINYGVSAEGYTTKSDSVIATADVTLNVVLEEEQEEEPVATYPTSNFYGWMSSNGIWSNNIFTLTETPTPNTIAYMSNACTDGRGNFAQDESSISDKHLSIDSDRIFLDDTTYWTRDSSLDGEFVSMTLFSDDATYETYAVPYPTEGSSTLVNPGDTLFLLDTQTQNMTALTAIESSWIDPNTYTITYNGHTLTPMVKVWQATDKIGG